MDRSVVRAEPDDAELIERSRAEPEQFSALFHRHGARIHRYIAQRLGVDVADDLMAETFLVAFRRRTDYDTGRRDARPWLYGIATKLVAHHRRAEVRRYRLLEKAYHEPLAAPLDDQVLDRVAAEQLHTPLPGVLAGLSPRMRNLLLLVAWADLSYEEVAEALDIPVGTVRSRLFRARRILREALPMLKPESEDLS